MMTSRRGRTCWALRCASESNARVDAKAAFEVVDSEWASPAFWEGEDPPS